MHHRAPCVLSLDAEPAILTNQIANDHPALAPRSKLRPSFFPSFAVDTESTPILRKLPLVVAASVYVFSLP